RLLHDSGYETAWVGKWHMGTDDRPRPGFDRWVGFKGQGVYVDPALNIDGQQVKATGYMTDLLTEHAVEFVKQPRARPFALVLAHKAVHGPFTPAERHKGLYADGQWPAPPSIPADWTGKPALTEGAKRRAQPQQPQARVHDQAMRQQLRCLAAIDEGVGK